MELISHCFPADKPILIMPCGDIQWAGEDTEIAMGMLKRHLQWGVDHGAWFIGLGDYIDTFSPSNRERLRNAAMYDTAVRAFDKDAEARVRELYELAFKPTKGRWLGLLEGHHFHEFQNGMTSDQFFADMLKAPFLGSCAYVELVFGSQRKGGGTVRIWAHHGAGSSSTAGGFLNRIERIAKSFDADIYIVGHQHSKDGKALDRVTTVPDSKGLPVLVHQTRLLVGSGSFLKGYVPQRRVGLVPRGSYVEKAMLNPVQLGAPLVTITPRWKVIGGSRVWLPDLGVSL